jgi:Na+:H+ antiporter, NhaA family
LIYADHIEAGLAGVALSFGANLLGIRKPLIYAVIGVCIWIAVLKSGVHATVAGVLLAFTIPARNYLDRRDFLKRSRGLLDRFEATTPHSFEEHASIHTLEIQCELFESPLHRIEHRLQPWVSFLVMPLFAFANAGVRVLGNVVAAVRHPVSLGVTLGLFIGKPLGIFTVAWLSAKLNLATPPTEVSWRQVFGASWICGIGFTMSLFIASLAFSNGTFLDMSKIGILVASGAAAVCGSIFLLRADRIASSSARAIESSGDNVVELSSSAG